MLLVAMMHLLVSSVSLRKHPDLESNQDLDFRRVPCVPLHHRDVGPTTGFAPASSGLQDRRLAKSSHVGMEDRMRSQAGAQ